MKLPRSAAALLICLLVVMNGRAEEVDFNTEFMRATVKISHDSSTAAGFILVNPATHKTILVTAAHVLETTKSDVTDVVFRRREAEGVYKKEPVKLVIRKDGKPTWTQHPTQDIAVITIEPPAGVDLAQISTELLATDDSLRKLKVHPGEAITCLGFPHRNEASEAGFPILRGGLIATFPLIPTTKTRHFYFSGNTFEGDSGGPVYLARPGVGEAGKETRLILGLVTAQVFVDEEAKFLYGTTKLRHRLGLAVIVHASLIRETIARMP